MSKSLDHGGTNRWRMIVAIRLLIAVVYLTVIGFGVAPSEAANDDGVFQCDFELSGGAVFTPDGRWLLGHGLKKTNKIESVGMVCVWEIATGKLVSKSSLYNVNTADVAVSNNGRWIGTFGSDSIAHLWSVQSQTTGKNGPLSMGATYRHYVLPPKTVVAGGRHGQMIFAPSNLEFATAGSTFGSRFRPDNKFSIKVWRTPDAVSTSSKNPRSTTNSTTGSTSGTLSKDSGASASATSPNDTEVSAGDQPRLTIPVEDWPTDITYSPDGKWVVAGFCTSPQQVGKARHPEVHFFDSETGGLKHKWVLSGAFNITQVGFDGSLVYSPDGAHLLICLAGEETAEIWHVESERVVWRGHSTGYKTGFSGGAFSADGKLLALSSRDHEIQLLRFPECEVISVGVTPMAGATIALSPDGKSLATQWKNDSYKLWNVEELLRQKRWWLDKKPGRRNAEITQPK